MQLHASDGRLLGMLVGWLRMSQNVTVLIELLDALEKVESEYLIPTWMQESMRELEDRIDLFSRRPF
jgi:hypothetical protein